VVQHLAARRRHPAITGRSCLVGISGSPFGAWRAWAKQSTPDGSAMPACAERVQMCASIGRSPGESKQLRRAWQLLAARAELAWLMRPGGK